MRESLSSRVRNSRSSNELGLACCTSSQDEDHRRHGGLLAGRKSERHRKDENGRMPGVAGAAPCAGGRLAAHLRNQRRRAALSPTAEVQASWRRRVRIPMPDAFGPRPDTAARRQARRSAPTPPLLRAPLRSRPTRRRASVFPTPASPVSSTTRPSPLQALVESAAQDVELIFTSDDEPTRGGSRDP